MININDLTPNKSILINKGHEASVSEYFYPGSDFFLLAFSDNDRLPITQVTYNNNVCLEYQISPNITKYPCITLDNLQTLLDQGIVSIV